MAGDAVAFARGSLALQIQWLAGHAGLDAPWTWAIGDAHHGNFATLATGRAGRDGVVAVRYGCSDVDDEHPAPWPWDVLRLWASVATSAPRLSAHAIAELMAACLGEYRRTLARIADDDDDAALRIDLHGLPEALKALIERDSEPTRALHHLAKRVMGQGTRARLRTNLELRADSDAKAFFLPALAQAWSGMPEHHRVLDLKQRHGGGLSSLGRRRWLALVHEQNRHAGARLRLVEIKERRPSVLARFLPIVPFAPHPGTARSFTVPMGGDPFQAVLHAPAGDHLARTRCHARQVLDLATLDAGDLRRLAMLWGQLLAGFHATGLAALVSDRTAAVRRIVADAHGREALLAKQALDLARFNHQAFAAFRRRRTVDGPKR